MVGMERASWREVGLLESASECGCDGSVGNTCAFGTGNRVKEAVAAGLKVFDYPRFIGICATLVGVAGVHSSCPRISLYEIAEI